MTIPDQILAYNHKQDAPYKDICELLAVLISAELHEAESKIWHAHPVWFLKGNPVVGYSRQKPGIRLMFWSGADFAEEGLTSLGKKFKDASVFYNHLNELKTEDLTRYLQKARSIQWDYKNIVKRKGKLLKLT